MSNLWNTIPATGAVIFPENDGRPPPGIRKSVEKVGPGD
jgi:hypothetical protein